MSPRQDGKRSRKPGDRDAVDRKRGVFMISVAAELSNMHPQTLRMYEARGLIAPKRSPRNTRLYSQEDVERLRRIQEMTASEGLNLAGVETVLELEEQLEKTQAELAAMRRRTAEMERELAEQLERARSLRAEIIPYGAYESPQLAPARKRPATVRIPIRRTRRGGDTPEPSSS